MLPCSHYRKFRSIVHPKTNLIQLAHNFCDQSFKDNPEDTKAIAREILQTHVKTDSSLINHEHEISKVSKDVAEEIVKSYPEEPTTCCMTGCVNCVWLDYAQQISDYYKDCGEKAKEQILKNVQDQNIQAFLLHELRMRSKSQS